MPPKCPYCDEELDYEERIDVYYKGNAFSEKWRGYCGHCQTGFTWWENYTLTSIEDIEQEKELE